MSVETLLSQRPVSDPVLCCPAANGAHRPGLNDGASCNPILYGHGEASRA